MAEERVRATQLLEWTDAKGDAHVVPPSVKHALEARFRGQTGMGKRADELLAFWEDEPQLVQTQMTMQEAQAGFSPSRMSCDRNVATRLVLKGDSSVSRGPYKYGKINTSKLLQPILISEKIPDEKKYTLCKNAASVDAKNWMKEYERQKHQKIADATTGAASEAAAELAALTKAEQAAQKRQQTLDSRVWMVLSDAQVAALHFLVAQFFFICRIPFAVIEHWAFIALVAGLCPAYAASLFKRICLSTTWLSKLYDETEEKTETKLNSLPGKNTVIVDGFKDRRKRHVMNIALAKVGFASYATTAWFGRRVHSGATYAAVE